MAIARNNSAMGDIELYSNATRYLDKLARRLAYGILMNRREARIIDGCFMAWRGQLADLFQHIEDMAM